MQSVEDMEFPIPSRKQLTKAGSAVMAGFLLATPAVRLCERFGRMDLPNRIEEKWKIEGAAGDPRIAASAKPPTCVVRCAAGPL
jgi:hypothetical protein